MILNRCPACGSNNIQVKCILSEVNCLLYIIKCGDCESQTQQYVQEAKAIEAWNKREIKS